MAKPDVILKYLFEAEYADGEIYKQTPFDKSRIDPLRSEFYDVLNSGKEIRKFSLVGDGHKATVDLLTGLFEVDGLRVLLESQKLPTLPDRFNLVFYRQWDKDIDVTYFLKTGEVLESKPHEGQGHCEYFIGWSCTISGKEYIQKLALA